jgi:hypothetical protein
MKIHYALPFLATTFLSFFPTLALATVSDTISPTVKFGRDVIEWRSGYSIDERNKSLDDRYRQRIHFDHPFTESFALRLIVSQDKLSNGDLRYSGSTAEGRIQFQKRGDGNVETGMRLIYTKADGAYGADTANVAFIGDYYFDKLILRGNLFVGHQLGQESIPGVALETRFYAAYIAEDKTRYGAEMFNNAGRVREWNGFDKQQHTIGPVVTGTFEDTPWGYQAGAQFGLSKAAPDAALKLFINYNF